MHLLLFTIFLLTTPLLVMTDPSFVPSNKSLSYLALGDSYTIGEGVEAGDRYPNQLVSRLNQSGTLHFAAPQIIAKTGWTVDELQTGIEAITLKSEGYDLVTLLIGVNNQYRGRSINDFEMEFEVMLLQAIGFARGKNDHVIVVSIPDWGITPFAFEKAVDQERIAAEIDAYNAAKKSVCSKMEVVFVDITTDYRAVGARPKMVAADGLHPSGEVYSRWTSQLLNMVQKIKF
jgi:lysophospholipase L1-like esterase